MKNIFSFVYLSCDTKKDRHISLDGLVKIFRATIAYVAKQGDVFITKTNESFAKAFGMAMALIIIGYGALHFLGFTHAEVIKLIELFANSK